MSRTPTDPLVFQSGMYVGMTVSEVWKDNHAYILWLYEFKKDALSKEMITEIERLTNCR